MSLFSYPEESDGPPGPAEPPRFIFLHNLASAGWKKILAHCETLQFWAGDTLLYAGDTDDAFYILTAGTVEVVLPQQNNAGPALTEIPEGSVFGELSFFDGQPRSASIRARSDGNAIRISRANFDHLSGWDPVLGRQILLDLGRIMSLRLRWTTELSQR